MNGLASLDTPFCGARMSFEPADPERQTSVFHVPRQTVSMG